MTGSRSSTEAHPVNWSLVRDIERGLGAEVSSVTPLGSGRADVLRLQAGTRTLIAKCFSSEYHDHFLRERAGLALLNELDLEAVPPLSWVDEPKRVLVMQAVSNDGDFEAVLSTPKAPNNLRTLLSMAERLGRLHASARPLAERFAEAPARPLRPGAQLSASLEETLAFIREALPTENGDRLLPVLRRELQALCRQLAQHDMATITLGDLAPSNVLQGSDGAVFIDLEYCAVRSPLYDAVFWHVIYSDLPASVIEKLDLAYREGWAQAGLEVTDEQFARQLWLSASERLFWMFSWGLQSLLNADREIRPGHSLRRVLLGCLRNYARIDVAANQQGALGQCARCLEEHLAQQW